MLLRETFKLAKEEGYKGICIVGEPEYYQKYEFAGIKERHTTTYRQMFVLESGVTIIDTPGMREIFVLGLLLLGGSFI